MADGQNGQEEYGALTIRLLTTKPCSTDPEIEARGEEFDDLADKIEGMFRVLQPPPGWAVKLDYGYGDRCTTT